MPGPDLWSGVTGTYMHVSCRPPPLPRLSRHLIQNTVSATTDRFPRQSGTCACVQQGKRDAQPRTIGGRAGRLWVAAAGGCSPGWCWVGTVGGAVHPGRESPRGGPVVVVGSGAGRRRSKSSPESLRHSGPFGSGDSGKRGRLRAVDVVRGWGLHRRRKPSRFWLGTVKLSGVPTEGEWPVRGGRVPGGTLRELHRGRVGRWNRWSGRRVGVVD